jgi:acetylornithine deacetylase/succinyl-diaminopimelate desuccinylase-like protein
MKKITLFLLLLYGTIYCQNSSFDYLSKNSSKFSFNVNGKSVLLENILQKYIQFPSVSGNEYEAGEFIKSVCKENGLIISDFGHENGSYNFAASIYPLSSGKPNIVFLNHIDVIPENSDSKYGAYSGKIESGNIYGRGAIDNKGVALMQLYSILQFLNKNKLDNQQFNITFLAVSCEEIQCATGIDYVIDNFIDTLNPVVVIGEGPTELTTLIGGKFEQPIFGISVAHKRPFWLELELISNTNGHGSITPLEYANKEMVASLNKLTKKKTKAVFNDLNISLLKDLSEEKKGFEKLVLKHPKLFRPILVPKLRKQPELFALFTNTITLTNIYTNSQSINKISSKTGASLDCRLLPETNENDFLNEIKKRLNNENIKISIVEQSPRSKPSSINNMYYTNIKRAITEKYPNSKTIPILMPNVSDLGAFRAKNIPAYATIPVFLKKEQAEAVHKNNEYISITSLYDGAQVYYNFLLNVEQGEN